MRHVFTAVFTLIFLSMATLALADVPTRMSVQGRLTNAAGAPVPPGFKNFTFKIFDASSGGIQIWPIGPGETQLLTTDNNGLWNAGLGAITPLTEDVFLSPTRWLEVTVDDGATPIETLPRIELRTGPYAYRAATSEQADSLAGFSIFQLADRFVDTSGDVMTGPLHNLHKTEDGPANIDVENVNDAHSPWWNNFQGVWGVQADAQGDDDYWTIGVAAMAIGDNSYIEGNRGVFTNAGGANSVNIGIESQTLLDGTANYSGYFTAGDFVVSNPQTVGTGGVMLPSNAIDNGEILDEPGVAFATVLAGDGPALTASSTAQDFVTVTITTPADGYIVVHGSATFRYLGTTLTNFAWMQIDETAAGNLGTRYCWSGAYNHAGITNEYETSSITRVYNLTAGAHTFRLEGNGFSGNNGSAQTYLFQCELMATFIPTSYGAVAATVAERSNFDDATLVKVSDPQANHSTQAYAVDLRELELKAARAQAEAEKARRELVEARLGAMSSAPRSSTQEKK